MLDALRKVVGEIYPLKYTLYTKVTIQLVDPVTSSPLVDSHNSLQWKMAHVQMISDELPVSEKMCFFPISYLK